MIEVPQWNGRDVELREFDIGAGERVLEASQNDDPKAAMYVTLMLSAYYVDDGTPVFASVDEIRRQPFRLLQRVQRLAVMATTLNSIEAVDGPLDFTRADIPASARVGNGQDHP